MIAKLLFLSACLAVTSFGAEKKVFEVSKVGADKTELKEVFGLVQEYETLIRKPVTRDFKVLRKIDEENFIVWPLDENGDSDTSITYWLATAQKWNAADGEIIHGVVAQKTEETKQQGSSTYRVMKASKPDPVKILTREEFTSLLKSGKTWIVPEAYVRKCYCTNGFVGYSKHDACDGLGKIFIDLHVKW